MIQMETYMLTYNPIFSLPIRMPGVALSIFCSEPTFQLALKGGCDESCIFEMNQVKNMWKITPMNFALGRLAYDIIWEDGLATDEIVQIHISYASVFKNAQQSQPTQSIESRSWSLDFHPRRWIMLPKSRRLLTKIHVILRSIDEKQQMTSSSSTSPSSSPPPSSTSSTSSTSHSMLPEFRLAIATIPLKIIDYPSVGGILDLSLVNHLSITDHKLNFSQVFGTWIVFDEPVHWERYSIQVVYFVE